MVIAMVAVICQPAVAQDEFKPITVFLIRHAEKHDEPRQDPPLTGAGVARSQALARLLSNAGVKAIFTSQSMRKSSTICSSSPCMRRAKRRSFNWNMEPN